MHHYFLQFRLVTDDTCEATEFPNWSRASTESVADTDDTYTMEELEKIALTISKKNISEKTLLPKTGIIIPAH